MRETVTGNVKSAVATDLVVVNGTTENVAGNVTVEESTKTDIGKAAAIDVKVTGNVIVKGNTEVAVTKRAYCNRTSCSDCK